MVSAEVRLHPARSDADACTVCDHMGSRQQAAIRGDEKAGAGNPAAGLVQFRRVIGVDLWERSGIRLQELGRRDRWWLDRLHRWLGGHRLGEHWSGPRRHRGRGGGRRPDQVIARSDGDVNCFTADDAAECEAKEMGDPRRHADKIAENH